jgi:hypothetical protein
VLFYVSKNGFKTLPSKKPLLPSKKWSIVWGIAVVLAFIDYVCKKIL